MNNIPQKIYLQIGEEVDTCEDIDFNNLAEVSWCKDKIYENDLVYLNKQYLRDYLNSHTVNDLCELILS